VTKKEAKKLFGRDIYRNLKYKDKHVYSVRKVSDRLVEGHALGVVLDDVTFHVSNAGNQRVRDEKRKNVHAWIRGGIINAVWCYKDMDKEEWAHALSATKDVSSMEWAMPASLNTKMNPDDPAAWTPMYKWKAITYDPYEYRSFVTVEGSWPIYNARKVIIDHEGVWAALPVTSAIIAN